MRTQDKARFAAVALLYLFLAICGVLVALGGAEVLGWIEVSSLAALPLFMLVAIGGYDEWLEFRRVKQAAEKRSIKSNVRGVY